ncbi:MAG: hypothetical protein LBS35_11665 [Synergistaceae bacterium]|jgi:hypothetical protein|nr:hypothetical protein [Synergistaceae bacterium]
MDGLGNEKLQGSLAGIRETELPGRRGGVSHYARAVYACFDDIQALISEGFTLSTICSFLEKKGVPPAAADPRSFCRAYRRECSRREQSAKQKKAKAKEVAKHDSAVKLAESSAAKAEQGLSPPQYQAPVISAGATRLEPGNKFKIEPINLGDLPDFESLTKRR